MAIPIRPTTPIKIDGVEYKLLFDYNAIADAEERLRAKGVEVNLVGARWHSLTASTTRALFIAGLKAHHPAIGDDEARALYGIAVPEDVVLAIQNGYRDALPEPEDEASAIDPILPGN